LKSDFAAYLAIDAVNWTSLKPLRDGSPLHYVHGLDNPIEDTALLAGGRALHSASFEPDTFPLHYAVYTGPTKGKGCRKERKAFDQANAEKTVITEESYRAVLGARDAIRKHPLVKPYLESGAAEQPIFWTDPETGLACKGRLDFISLGARGAILDLKSTITVDQRRFSATAARLGYHCQAAFYRAGWKVATGEDLPVRLIAVERTAPHDVAVFQVNDDALYAAEEELHGLLARVAECRQSGKWPGRYETEQVLELPRWVFPEDADLVETPDGLRVA
jgi:exodeoxyribonuclease VIII